MGMAGDYPMYIFLHIGIFHFINELCNCIDLTSICYFETPTWEKQGS